MSDRKPKVMNLLDERPDAKEGRKITRKGKRYLQSLISDRRAKTKVMTIPESEMLLPVHGTVEVTSRREDASS